MRGLSRSRLGLSLVSAAKGLPPLPLPPRDNPTNDEFAAVEPAPAKKSKDRPPAMSFSSKPLAAQKKSSKRRLIETDGDEDDDAPRAKATPKKAKKEGKKTLLSFGDGGDG